MKGFVLISAQWLSYLGEKGKDAKCYKCCSALYEGVKKREQEEEREIRQPSE